MRAFDPSDEDVGNVLAMEHVNITVSDQPTAITFYLMGMGFTRDPFNTVGLENMHVNVGEQQFHLPTRPPEQVIAGHVGMVVPDLDRLMARLEQVKPKLAGTKFAWSVEPDHLAVTCPWGNQLRCYAPNDRFGDVMLGIPYVHFQTRPATAAGIARFYEGVFGAPSTVEHNGDAPTARVSMGRHQWLEFEETEGEIRPYDGHHIAVYLADFSRPYRFCQEHELLKEEAASHQFRFTQLVDPDTLENVFELEHEVRSLRHLQFRRQLVNRDPENRSGIPMSIHR